MPTYTESLFEPLEAWIAENYPQLETGEPQRLRLIVSRMILEHAGRGANPVIRLEPGRTEITEAEAERLRDALREGLRVRRDDDNKKGDQS